MSVRISGPLLELPSLPEPVSPVAVMFLLLTRFVKGVGPLLRRDQTFFALLVDLVLVFFAHPELNQRGRVKDQVLQYFIDELVREVLVLETRLQGLVHHVPDHQVFACSAHFFDLVIDERLSLARQCVRRCRTREQNVRVEDDHPIHVYVLA